mmetsp:Transcript_12530/g.31963  ORF Transcript_12530/g.31963 Transcript_12530/m.31963 type:complete len:221 (-) Transcript_12530:585-1247(-)
MRILSEHRLRATRALRGRRRRLAQGGRNCLDSARVREPKRVLRRRRIGFLRAHVNGRVAPVLHHAGEGAPQSAVQERAAGAVTDRACVRLVHAASCDDLEIASLRRFHHPRDRVSPLQGGRPASRSENALDTGFGAVLHGRDRVETDVDRAMERHWQRLRGLHQHFDESFVHAALARERANDNAVGPCVAERLHVGEHGGALVCVVEKVPGPGPDHGHHL